MQVVVDRSRKVARFFGPGTFQFKDDIKALGKARWVNDRKEWEVSDFLLPNSEIESLFPGIELSEESAGTSDSAAVAASTSKITAEIIFDDSDRSFPAVEASLVEKTDNPTKTVNGVSVKEFLINAKAAIERAFPGVIYVFGVISNVNRQDNGRVRLDLSDIERPDDRVSCVIWSGADLMCRPLTELGIRLERDVQVMLKIKTSLNPRGGQLSLSVVGIVAEYTIAKLRAQREVTNEKLKREGLFGRNKEKTLPLLPRKLGVLTSSAGTVIHDFMKPLEAVQFGFDIRWLPVSVQGNEAKLSILRGIEKLAAMPDLDAILIFRGGGSPAELAIFNDYDIARAVCLCEKPVVSAIGHQEDQSSVQDVSFWACGVPMDVGRYFADLVIDLRNRVNLALEQIRSAVDRTVVTSEHFLLTNFNSIRGGVAHLLRSRSDAFKRYQRELPVIAKQLLFRSSQSLREKALPLKTLSERALEQREQRVVQCWERIDTAASRLQESGIQIVLRKAESFRRSCEDIISAREMVLERISGIVEGSSPETQLKRGFVIVRRDSDSALLSDAEKLGLGETLKLEFRDGTVSAKVLEKKK